MFKFEQSFFTCAAQKFKVFGIACIKEKKSFRGKVRTWSVSLCGPGEVFLLYTKNKKVERWEEES